MNTIRQRPLRPLSSATDLTDYTDITHSTLEADVGGDRDQGQRVADPIPTQSDPQSDEADFESVSVPQRCGMPLTVANHPFVQELTCDRQQENERLNMQHTILRVLLQNKNWFAPLKRPKRMLDIGCGTGIWCLEMANVDFFIDDIRRKEWWHCTQPYDYIHTRMSMGIFRDFREIIQKGFNNLEPGGFMESHELYPKLYCTDGTMPADWELLEWTRLEDKAAMQLGTPLRIANKLKTWYEQAGFVDVYEEVFHIPVNAWAKDPRDKLIGKFMMWNMCEGVHAWSIEYFVKALGWTEVEVEVYLAHLRTAIVDKSVHAFYKVYVVHGRKPRAGEERSRVVKPAHWPTEPGSDDEGDDDDDAVFA
ncbi:hypothetical protein SNOG_15775 [Parastagonospora nodorum SN15]|uniref:S-adenosyl-L-methionine-dependent methyltransferase n=1 Tax=Phaeosphaeria nodorum (strain SN15 / ATCC MYA-4574 / FGSC 10173) TaxID=321614 RepID=Q0TXL3_PHANO|nr:hypothetical protein SNOG_15775 [Parastagonospora nodorum SN15]EAT76870.2 hypothetical protein SNOG_15775 [Parastagonospora nodorum SN15]